MHLITNFHYYLYLYLKFFIQQITSSIVINHFDEKNIRFFTLSNVYTCNIYKFLEFYSHANFNRHKKIFVHQDHFNGQVNNFIMTIYVKTGKNSIFLNKCKTVISVGNRKFSRYRMEKRTSPLNLSREI